MIKPPIGEILVGGLLHYLNCTTTIVVSKCALAGILYKPSSGRKVAREA